MRVNIFRKVKAAMPQEPELDKIVHMMQTSQVLQARTEVHRKCVVRGHKQETKTTKIHHFPAFAPCAFFYDGKGRDNVIGLTGLCYLDYDHVKEDRLITEAIENLRKNHRDRTLSTITITLTLTS